MEKSRLTTVLNVNEVHNRRLKRHPNGSHQYPMYGSSWVKADMGPPRVCQRNQNQALHQNPTDRKPVRPTMEGLLQGTYVFQEVRHMLPASRDYTVVMPAPLARALCRLEPNEGKLSRPVLRGGSDGNVALTRPLEVSLRFQIRAPIRFSFCAKSLIITRMPIPETPSAPAF